MTATEPALIPTTHDALLLAVLLAPHDDQPRLIYADWCDENGQEERAEFIREMIACGRNWLTDPYFYRVVWKKGEDAPMESSCKKYGFSPNFIDVGELYINNGFVREIHVTHDYFLEHAAAIFAAHPVERVVLTDVPLLQSRSRNYWYFEAMWINSELRRVSQQRLHGNFASRDLAADALSAACVALGRERAGLPPLTA